MHDVASNLCDFMRHYLTLGNRRRARYPDVMREKLATDTYSYYDNGVRVHQAALKHGVDPEDSIKAATEYLVAIDIEEGNPSRQLRLGFSSTGQLLETVVLTFDDSRELVIHSMNARRAYYDLLR